MTASAYQGKAGMEAGRRHAASIFLILHWTALLFAAGHPAQALAEPKVHKVSIEGLKNSPQVVEAAPGDTVIWTNKDPFPHTVTSSGAGKNRGFDSGQIAPGHSWKLKVRDKGEFSYICTLHPTMKGTLVVK